MMRDMMIRFNAADRKPLNDILLSRYFQLDESYNIYDDNAGQNKPGLCVIISQEKFHNVINTI